MEQLTRCDSDEDEQRRSPQTKEGHLTGRQKAGELERKKTRDQESRKKDLGRKTGERESLSESFAGQAVRSITADSRRVPEL
jgi:hypothetical protein